MVGREVSVVCIINYFVFYHIEAAFEIEVVDPVVPFAALLVFVAVGIISSYGTLLYAQIGATVIGVRQLDLEIIRMGRFRGGAIHVAAENHDEFSACIQGGNPVADKFCGFGADAFGFLFTDGCAGAVFPSRTW